MTKHYRFIAAGLKAAVDRLNDEGRYDEAQGAVIAGWVIARHIQQSDPRFHEKQREAFLHAAGALHPSKKLKDADWRTTVI